jgi:hypothetical protein
MQGASDVALLPGLKKKVVRTLVPHAWPFESSHHVICTAR